MEILGAVISIMECISPHAAKRWQYHRDFAKNRDALIEMNDKLNSRMNDITSELDMKLMPEKTEIGKEVFGWLERVNKIFEEIEDIKKQIEGVRFHSRARLGRKIFENKLKVDELYEEGVFSGDSLIRRLPQRGNMMSTPTMMEVETTSKRIEEEIWKCLLDEKVTKIGVHGMGGAGKTTVVERINNRLLEEKDMFDKVIWVTVSNNSSITSLQDKLACKLEIDISGVDGEDSRAQELRKGFLKSKRFVLILDDLWKVEHDTLKKVGILDPMPVEGCKLILTTRFLDVCRKVNCDMEILLNLLSEVEALELFREKVGREVSSDPKLEELVKQVTRECARLPPAIVTMAGALRKKTDPNEWEVALADLKDSSASISSEVMRILRMSYDWLNDKKLKDCLLYCALYPEDYSIEKSMLVDQLIADGMVEDTKTRKYHVAKGHVMLKELISVGFLSDSSTEDGGAKVKMHDLIRDMAIQIMRETSHRFMVKAGEELQLIPVKESWNEDLEKVTLMGNNIVEISSSIDPPNCPKLSTLFLNSNRHLKTIPNNFFSYMKELRVLNLSNTGIKNLPESVSDLESLVMLLLEGCKDLIYIPSLSNLTDMKQLNLSGTAIIEVPKGLEVMTKLSNLNLCNTRLKLIPDGILCKLTNLQFLSFINEIKVTVSVNEVSNLRELETFEASMDFNTFESLFRSFEVEKRRHVNTRILVLPERTCATIRSRKNMVLFYESEIKCDGAIIEVPKNIEVLRMSFCNIHASSLSRIFSLDNKAKLVEVCMHRCTIIEHLFDCSPLPQTIERVNLQNMANLRGLVCIESRPPSPGSFSSLTHLVLAHCPKLKMLFNGSDPSLLNLVLLEIVFCDDFEEILSLECDWTTMSVPKLQQLRLAGLPKLKSIPLEAESLQEIDIISCPMTEEFHLIDREPYPPSLERVNIDGCAWSSRDGIKWDWNTFNARRRGMGRSGSEDRA